MKPLLVDSVYTFRDAGRKKYCVGGCRIDFFYLSLLSRSFGRMRSLRNLTLVVLVWLLALAARAQENVHFVVNGQACTDGRCVLSLSSYALGQPLRLSLTGVQPGTATLGFSFSQAIEATRPVRGLLLEYGGYSVASGAGIIRVPAASAAALFNATTHLVLHLGDIPPIATGVLTVAAHVKGQAQPIAKVQIFLEGLQTPGESIPWERGQRFDEVRPQLVPVYPNPVKSGPVHIDLQSIPAGRKGWVSIVDLLGATIYNAPFEGGTIVECPADSFSKGVYFVRIDVEGTPIFTGRLIIDR